MSKNNPPNPAAPTPTPATVPVPTMISLSKEDLITLIREARRDPQAEAKIAAESFRFESRRKQMVMIAKREEQARIDRQARCQHRKPNGEESSGGQELSDGRVIILCLRCQKVLRSYWTAEVARGMAIQARLGELGVTDEDIRRHMEIKGEGNPDDDIQQDFVKTPKGPGSHPSLTT